MTDKQVTASLAELGLGKPTEYRSHYAPELLQAVPRSLNRQELGVAERQPFYGVDVWHGYELSWLNPKGKPVVALLRCLIPASSPNLVESKSFKLYLNSYNQSRFEGMERVSRQLTQDLSKITGGDVSVELFEPDDIASFVPTSLPGICIDDLDIEVHDYDLNVAILADRNLEASGPVTEILHSHLLKSNCLITNQPDWASVVIEYQGEQIDREKLLKYLVSFRLHNEFHEQCVERIFMDIQSAYELDSLSVQALYTRRGGLDINPFRSTDGNAARGPWRINRQ